jgi:cysteine-rich repeat protein
MKLKPKCIVPFGRQTGQWYGLLLSLLSVVAVTGVPAVGPCDQVVILQNRDTRYVALDALNALSWEEGQFDQLRAEVFFRIPTSNGFMLKSGTNGNFVEIQDGGLFATGMNGTVFSTEACGADFTALRADLDDDGDPLNDAGNYWRSDDPIIDLVGGCNPASGSSWEKFRVVVTAANTVCDVSCDDGIQNQGEGTWADCGGPNCAACPPPTCDDGILNQGEASVDCGGSNCSVGPACEELVRCYNLQPMGRKVIGQLMMDSTCDYIDGCLDNIDLLCQSCKVKYANNNGEETAAWRMTPALPECSLGALSLAEGEGFSFEPVPTDPRCPSEALESANLDESERRSAINKFVYMNDTEAGQEKCIFKSNFVTYSGIGGGIDDAKYKCEELLPEAYGVPMRLVTLRSAFENDFVSKYVLFEGRGGEAYTALRYHDGGWAWYIGDNFYPLQLDNYTNFNVGQDQGSSQVNTIELVPYNDQTWGDDDANPDLSTISKKWRAFPSVIKRFVCEICLSGLCKEFADPPFPPVSASSCADDIQNQGETGVDCGGPCDACPSSEPPCSDGIMNQGETGVDCGGPCDACLPSEPTCSDGIMNQGETGVDCGGSSPCDPCPPVCGDGIVDEGEQCDDGNTQSCDSCSAVCQIEIESGNCDQVVILQNRGGRYVTLDGASLSRSDGTQDMSAAEVFIREWNFCDAFTLKSASNGNFVELQANVLSATGTTTGMVFSAEACGTAPFGFSALRADRDGDGNALNDAGNYWKSNDVLDLTGGCTPGDTTSWEKFQVVVTSVTSTCDVGCFDGIQNQDEDGIDCGGPCGEACPGFCGDGIFELNLGEECDDGDSLSCDGCSADCEEETKGGMCDNVVILQNRGGRYVTLDGASLSWSDGTQDERGAEVFIRVPDYCGFTLKSTTSGYFVELDGNTLGATGLASGIVFDKEECGVVPVDFGALRADTNGDGDALNDAGNYWKSDSTLGLTGGCPAGDGGSWEKFQVVVTSENVDCDGEMEIRHRLRGQL